MPKSSPNLRVAVIGAGNMGKNHLRNYFEMTNADLVGLADINPATKELADQYETAFFTDYKAMLDEVKPDAVSIVVPTPFHAEVATEVMNRGISCLLEKPIASTVEEAEALIKLSLEKGVVFTVGHIEHYNPLIVALKDLLDKSSIGEVTSIVCKRVGGFPQIEPKTDVIIDLAVHDIGIISYLLGVQPNKITSHGSRTYHSNKIDSAEILLDYGKASGFIQANWLTPVKIRTISVTGSEGYIEGNYITQELSVYKHTFTQKFNEAGYSGVVNEMKAQEKELINVNFEEPLARELQTFLEHAAGDTTNQLVSPAEARGALGLALEAASSYNEE
jgi:UDP-N-acetylglucosamine 3-dehydrogenase